MNVITELPSHSMTLRPATETDRIRALGVFAPWLDETDGRFVISPTITVDGRVFPFRYGLSEHWEDVDTEEGVAVMIRAADCGAGCRCAGEFTFPGAP